MTTQLYSVLNGEKWLSTYFARHCIFANLLRIYAEDFIAVPSSVADRLTVTVMDHLLKLLKLPTQISHTNGRQEALDPI